MLPVLAVRDRLFFAVRPPYRLAVRIANAADWHTPDGMAPLAADRLHVTLFLLPDLHAVTAPLIDQLRHVGDSVRAAPFEMVLDYLSAGARSIALRPQHRIRALDRLRGAIAGAARHGGITERPGYAFNAHLTLGYRAGDHYGQPIAPVRWTADELVLIRSRLGRSRHEVIDRWPLRDAPEPQLSLF